MRRRFNAREAIALYLAAGGRCQRCGQPLRPGWHADHVVAFARGGRTLLDNGQALCPTCNKSKGAKLVGTQGAAPGALPPGFSPLDWQDEFFQQWRRHSERVFLLEGCTGSGKTKAALWVLWYAIRTGIARQAVVFVPTEPLKRQWRDAAAAFGLNLTTRFQSRNMTLAPDEDGAVVTYSQAAQSPATFRHLCLSAPTFAAGDEIHHAAVDRPFALGVDQAFSAAVRALLLSGTPFRTDGVPIPSVRYDANGRSMADYAYGYRDAVRDDVCRPVLFPAMDGYIRWERDARILEGYLDDVCTDPEEKRRLRQALNVRGEYLKDSLRTADRRLTEHRLHGHAAAGGLVTAIDQNHALRIAQLLQTISGEAPVVAISDDPTSLDQIDRFRSGKERWLVSVRMVSEGVDIPRLRVGVWATNVLTELFFRQFIGRLCRHDYACPVAKDADCFIPAVHTLQAYARRVMDECEAGLADRRDQAGPQPSGAGAVGPGGSIDTFISADQNAQVAIIVDGQHFAQDEVDRAERLLAAMGLREATDVQRHQALIGLREQLGAVGVSGPTATRTAPGAPPLDVQKLHVRRAIQAKVGQYVAWRLGPGASSAQRSQCFQDTYIKLNDGTDGLNITDGQVTLAGLESRLKLIDRWLGGQP